MNIFWSTYHTSIIFFSGAKNKVEDTFYIPWTWSYGQQNIFQNIEKKIDLKNLSLENLLINLIDNNSYKKNTYVKELLIDLIQLFFLNKYKLPHNKKNYINLYHDFMLKIYNTNKFNLDEESLFLEFKTKLLNV